MYLKELMAQKEMIDRKIKELKGVLNYNQTDKLAEELFKLLELRQEKLLNIDAANNASSISIGGTTVTISMAVRLKNTIVYKLEVLTDLLENDSCSLDKLELQKQRDTYYEDYVLLDMAIERNDLNVELKEK